MKQKLNEESYTLTFRDQLFSNKVSENSKEDEENNKND